MHENATINEKLECICGRMFYATMYGQRRCISCIAFEKLWREIQRPRDFEAEARKAQSQRRVKHFCTGIALLILAVVIVVRW